MRAQVPVMLEKIKSPHDIKNLGPEETSLLAAEIREKIISSVSENGGHLASNLGMVEATVAIHKVFDSPEDKIIFDVSHQCYAHKLITGRIGQFHTLRKFGGLSGFTNPEESEHDLFREGHSGSSVSAALGIAAANKIAKNGRFAVAVVGDGSLTNGMIYEALNNCGDKELDLVIIINDNEMSISRNVGGLHSYLSRIRTSNGYFTFKRKFESGLSKIPLIGYPLARILKLFKDSIKRFFISNTIFEDLGLVYLGPVDGHDTEKLCRVLTEAKSKHRCCVVHIRTKKGRGYAPAESTSEKYHAVGSFDPSVGVVSSTSAETFSSKMGEIITEAAKADGRICAVTAAMTDGTGLSGFAKEFPERFFDVGIAEEHAITFAAGLSAAGMMPVVALYSTFSQRVYDQVLHDVSIQSLPMVLALDRAGIVPGDGITHQGIFDYPLFSTIPGINIYSPATFSDLKWAFSRAFTGGELAVIRYPKGGESVMMNACSHLFRFHDGGSFEYTDNITSCKAVIVTYGRAVEVAIGAAEILEKTDSVGIVRLKKIFPIDEKVLALLMDGHRLIYVLEESGRNGGFCEKLSAALAQAGCKSLILTKAIDGYIPHGTVEELWASEGFTAEKAAAEITEALSAGHI